ncbi:iron-containing redox enzyme family protein [Xenorhabdus khoisanae]|uniref:iron-containing redox enzyme family protein n=1 Tax=Xenorhabdus khoisanae TaxID=880157 RepID=UPI0023590223|nr:iron-containing redox enzyme family protein [Xenorhabdus khoisanae]MDC9613240.1 iron-containing redox enzyme family protein [Xenorhabdus khoisanae]
MLIKDYLETPKFVHNLWTKNEDNEYFLRFIKGLYKVDPDDAKDFLKIRRYCTGHNTITELHEKTGISKSRIMEIVSSLNEIEMLRNENIISQENFIDKIIIACDMWAEQIEETHLFNKFLYGDVSYNVLLGFMLENYHYIKLFPQTITLAIENTRDERTKNALEEYQKQEIGHEVFMLRCLLKMGLKKDEVETSIPLVSTSNIINMMNDLFSKYPESVFLVAKVIESHDYDEDEVSIAIDKINQNYRLDQGTLEPFFEHSKIDYELGHSQILEKNKPLIRFDNIDCISYILNAIHDIKHAIDLQCLEIEDYYTKQGNYIPRQRVDYFGI